MPNYGPPSNPLGFGIANFISSFANARRQDRDAKNKQRGKEAYYNLMRELAGKKQAGAERVAQIKNVPKAGGRDDVAAFKVLIDAKNKAKSGVDTYLKTMDPMGIEDPETKTRMRAEYLRENPDIKETIERGLQAEMAVAKMKNLTPAPSPEGVNMSIAPNMLQDPDDEESAGQ
jgi:hypothetical protein